MGRLGVFAPTQGYRRVTPLVFCFVVPTIRWYPFILLVGEKCCEKKVFFPITQHNKPQQVLGHDPLESRAQIIGVLRLLTRVYFWHLYLSAIYSPVEFRELIKSTNNQNLQFLSFKKIYTLLGFL